MYKKITYKSKSGAIIDGILSGPEDSETVVILLPGFMSNKDRPAYTRLEKEFNAAGISTYRFDFFGMGESSGDISDLTLTKATDDALGAVAEMKKLKFEKICLHGSSFGGNIAILAAAKTKDVCLLGLRCPVANYENKIRLQKTPEFLKKWKNQGIINYSYYGKESVKLKYSYFLDVQKNNGYAAAEKIFVPVIVVHGDKDIDAPYEQSLEIMKHLRNGKLFVIKGAGHKFDGPGEFDEVVKETLKFFLTNL